MAHGACKNAAIRATIRTGWANVLITDVTQPLDDRRGSEADRCCPWLGREELLIFQCTDGVAPYLSSPRSEYQVHRDTLDRRPAPDRILVINARNLRRVPAAYRTHFNEHGHRRDRLGRLIHEYA